MGSHHAEGYARWAVGSALCTQLKCSQCLMHLCLPGMLGSQTAHSRPPLPAPAPPTSPLHSTGKRADIIWKGAKGQLGRSNAPESTTPLACPQRSSKGNEAQRRCRRRGCPIPRQQGCAMAASRETIGGVRFGRTFGRLAKCCRCVIHGFQASLKQVKLQ